MKKLYTDEFDILDGGHYIRFTKNINGKEFILYGGIRLASAPNGYIDSEPPSKLFDISEYTKMVAQLILRGRGIMLPEHFHESLIKYSRLWQKDAVFAFLDMDTIIEFWCDWCQVFEIQTKTVRNLYECSSCGVELLYDANFCWACEHGI